MDIFPKTQTVHVARLKPQKVFIIAEHVNYRSLLPAPVEADIIVIIVLDNMCACVQTTDSTTWWSKQNACRYYKTKKVHEIGITSP